MKKKESKLKENKQFNINKVYERVILFLMASPLFVYVFALLIVEFFKLKTAPSIGDVSAWIGYAGAVISGLVTMVAVVATLKFEENKRIQDKAEYEQKRIQDKEEYEQRLALEKAENQKQRLNDRGIALMPLLKCKSIVDHTKLIESLSKFGEFSIENISTNHCSKLKINKVSLVWLEPAKEHPGSFDQIFDDDLYFVSEENSVDVSLLPSGSEHRFRIYFRDPNQIDEIKKIRNPGTNCVVKMSFTFEDILGIFKYQHEYILVLSQEINHSKMLTVDNHIVSFYKFYNETNEFYIE